MSQPVDILWRGVRLELLLRFRSVGPWPWIALLAWGGIARAQEPVMLRNHSIHLTCHSLWFGATILLACLAVQSPRRSPSRSNIRTTVSVAGALTLVVALAQATLGILLDLAFPGPLDIAVYGQSFALFLAAWFPLALVWSVPVAGSCAAGLLVQGITTLATLLIAVPLWRLGGWAFVASAGVLVGAWSGLRWAGVLQSRSVPSASPPDQTAAPQPRF